MKLISMSEGPEEEARPPGPATRRLGTIIARRLRLLPGVREEVLDKIPAERTRYTALAAVMVCTASIGGFSMFFALSEVMGKAGIWFVFLAVFWATFILCVDCWLVSSTAGSRWRTRVSVLLPRLAIAAVFGIVIAEPLVLRVFQTGIVNYVKQERQDAIDNLRTALVNCNPIPGVAGAMSPPSGDCAGMILNISNSSAATLTTLNTLRGQASALQTQVNKETAQLTQLQNTVNNECNGHTGSGLTGIVGNGPACHQDQQDVDNYRASHPIAAQNTLLSSLNEQISSAQGSLSTEQANYKAAISQAITKRLQAETAPDAPIGMAERYQALTYLSVSNSFIAVTSWFVRIFFILIDCLPVLVKFISGSTPYDRLIDTEVNSAEKRFSRENETSDAVAEEDNDVRLWQAKADAARRKKEINLKILRQDAERETSKEDAIDELWRRKLAARRSHRASENAGASSPGGIPNTSWDEYDHILPHLNGASSPVDDTRVDRAE
jgi:hypothetical protein